MHLKRLELVGFKSFAAKTVLDFPAGITAVVGPNGSGKSNIIDAIRWLLGEREAKNMRGLKAEDLIFAGTPERPRVGLAQATIVFDNHSRFFPVDYAEVSIRRRVERDGTSKHFLNDAEVRLKDIIDFFAQSRLGTKGFSIINQGDSDLFVRATPKDRRSMLEEILGLRQFHLKKHDAELKLKNTKFNMEKAKALIEEILPHLKLLRRQTAKWEKHDELVSELREFENQYFGSRLKEITAEGKSLSPELERLEHRTAILKKELKALEDELTRVGESGPKTEKDFKELSKEKDELFTEHAKLERELGRLEAQIEISESQPDFDFNPEELVKLLEETRETLEDAIMVSDLKVIKKLLQALSEKIAHVMDADADESVKVKSIDAKASEKLRGEITDKLQKIDGRLAELKKLETEENFELKSFKTVFSKAYEAVQKKRDEISVLEAEKNKARFAEERIRIRKDELKHQIEQAGRKIEEFENAGGREDGKDAETLGQMERRILRLRGELATIGEIDQGLIKEAEETETRYKFLESQIADLEKAYDDLTSLIKDLETKIHDDFKTALKTINEEFHNYFRMMFGGGQAKLRLKTYNLQLITDDEKGGKEEGQENDENEESKEELGGLDIEISIPRKRITGLDMLSGGEKSLVSLAVLFALISVSPPPFLVLDEVDAALDEVNTKRFAELIKDFSKKTQFLVVTHNRATMEAADILYGITMGEDGTSKVLSLKLE